jgi:hypothetical protein
LDGSPAIRENVVFNRKNELKLRAPAKVHHLCKKRALLFKTAKSRDRKMAADGAENLWKNRPNLVIYAPEIWGSVIMWVVEEIDLEVCKLAHFDN